MIVGFLTILKGYIGSEKYKDYRNDLLFFKYYIALINKEIENGMLANQFDVSDSFDCNTEFIAQLIGVVDEVKDFHKNRIGADVSRDQLSSLLAVPDDKYDEKRTVESSILRQCLLRSAFLLMDEEFLEDYHETFHKIIEGDYYLSKFGDDPIGARAIKKCFLAINKDRKKVRGFSIRLGQD